MTTTFKSLFDALNELRKLWEVLAKGPAPDDRTLALWMKSFNEEELVYAFGRVNSKMHDRAIGPNDTTAHRYCTSVLINERQRRKEAGARQIEATRG
jgi:hypothetical protein